MGLNKRKVLDAAQKYLQKGNLDRALKEYQKVLEADPRDANVRLKVGDVQLRRGKSEEAIEAYFEVAKQFMKNGFDAKAVALFKQITKIDEKRYDIYEPLAELYQRLGLVSEAMTALQTAAEAHQREGRKKEGLTLLRKMASLDPSNTGTRLKIAQLLWKESLQDEALEEYDEIVAELGRQGDLESAVRVHEQVLSELPERLENLVGLGVAQLELERPEAAEPSLLKATEVSVEAVEAWEALARVHEALGRTKELEDTWKTVAAIYKDRGDEDRAKEILQLYVTPEALDADEEDEAPDAAPSEEIPGGQTIGDLAGDTGEDLDLDIGEGATAPEAPVAADAPELDLDDEIEIELDEELPDGEAGAPDETPQAEAPAEADPAQLLAEAGVYLRYSQHDKAVTCLEQILEEHPNHVEALEKLGETRNAMGEADQAVALFKRAATQAREAGDGAGFARLCDALRAVDEAAAEEMAADALTPQLEGTPEPELEMDLELEFDTPSGDPELSGVADESGLDVEVEMLLNETPDREAARDPEAPPSEEVEQSASPGETTDAAASRAGASSGGPVFEKRTGGVTLGASSRSSDVSAEDLEEAEFYFRQGLFDEAEQLLRRLLEAAPGHPQVLLRLGEIAKSRGECPSSPVGEGVDFDRTEEETNPALDVAASGDDSIAPDDTLTPREDGLSDATLEDLDALPDLGGPEAGPDDETLQAELSDALPEMDDPADASHGATLGSETEPVPPAPAPEVTPKSQTAPPSEATPEPQTAPPSEVAPAPMAAADAGDGFDLAAELSGVFDDSSSGVGDATMGGTTQAGFESIFQSFKQGVKETLGEGEEETHYDLGIAYREMGLFEDAIGEFRVAMNASARRLDCLAMMGLCALDLGRADDAVSHLEQALAMPGLEDDRMAGLRFDLGRAFERQGDLDRARSTWEQVVAFDPEFQDVGRRLEQLGQEDSTPSLGELDPDDLTPGETFESFDDLIAEAEADIDGDDDDDPGDGDDGPGSGPDTGSGDDSEGEMGSTQWGRKVSYG